MSSDQVAPDPPRLDPPRLDPPWLNETQLRDWVALVAMFSTLPAALDAQLKRDSGLNLFEYQVLVQLADSPGGRLPMSDLAAMAKGSPSRLTHAVARLERAGYVTKTACRSAGRRTATILTGAGRQKLEETAPGHVREARRLVVDVLSADQLAAAGEACRAIVGATAPEYTSVIRPDLASQSE